jgi:hypothetical protein
VATFSPQVEQWRGPLNQYGGGDLPGGEDFLLAWIDKESNGDTCSYTSMHESGVFQLMPPDNTARGGTTEAALRSMCSGGSGSATRSPTDAEIQVQIQSGLQYIRYLRDVAHQKLDAAGVSWDESNPDFWRIVKLQHAYPAPTAIWLAAATAALGRVPDTWDEFVQYGVPPQYTGPRSVIDNAETVGAFGGGGGAIPGVALFLLGGLALAYYLWQRR